MAILITIIARKRTAAINISAMQRGQGHLSKCCFDMLAEPCIASDPVEIEPTDRRLRAHPKQALAIPNEIRTVGVILAIDEPPEYPHKKGRNEIPG